MGTREVIKEARRLTWERFDGKLTQDEFEEELDRLFGVQLKLLFNFPAKIAFIGDIIERGNNVESRILKDVKAAISADLGRSFEEVGCITNPFAKAA